MEAMQLVEEGISWARSRIVGIGDASLDAPTPCDEWNLRQLVNHTVNAVATIAGVLSADGEHDAWGAGARTPQEMADADTSWPNPVEHYDEVTGVVLRAARETSSDRTFLMNGVPQPAVALARAVAFDSVLHAWDIAKATGQDETIPAEVAEALLAFAAGIPEAARGFVFGPAVDVPATASSTARLVGFLGRQP